MLLEQEKTLFELKSKLKVQEEQQEEPGEQEGKERIPSLFSGID